LATSQATPPVAIQKQVLEIQQATKVLTIRNADDYKVAGEMSNAISQLRKQIDATFDPIIAKAHEAHKEAIAQKRKFSLPLEMDQRLIDGKLMAWSRQQEEIRRRKEAELAAELKKKQEDEALAQAEELERQGSPELAETVLQQQVEAPAPVVALPTETPRIAGFAKRTIWRFRIVNPELVPREYLSPDELKIGGVVRSLKGATKIPGVQVYEEDAAIHRG
jgi:hypothetical protein